MTEKLPPHLRRLFEPRPPIKHVKPLDRNPQQRRGPIVGGLAEYVHMLKDYDPDYVPRETLEERRKRLVSVALQRRGCTRRVLICAQTWDPHNDPHASGDPYKTLFVGRLHYEATEDDIRRAFDRYGNIAKLQIIREKDSAKSRGYAFIEYEDERDMKGSWLSSGIFACDI
ncbi:hypothetical protein THASP1DRAFT_17335 [Thamnocephalis sphaerospora]|uniref:RRM domain-containing protein n=1 Tax=Thamnocephalis sphaerospora TaxID=78915 RepID=A0A4P9XPQ8_9FUNG|nr:hypothetical protein THASP1DRAFT_17335 [Thamnocephalis sphaerospora]|eukprot:RKP07250.1 hypothetical protein THASP1DRAFT_17335 [Thamnocephalis sphaerospora]